MVLMIRFLLVIFGVIGGLFGAVWFVQTPVFTWLTDTEAPVISVTSGVSGLGVNIRPFAVKVSEEGSGVKSLVALLRAPGKEKACEVKRGAETKELAAFSVACDPVAGGFSAGSATVSLQATDASFWSNFAEKEFAVDLDFTAPQIEILTLQHVVHAGGSELVLFHVLDDQSVTAEVRVGPFKFSASPARALDPSFPEQSKTFVSVFALPLDWDPKSSPAEARPRIRVTDKSGNWGETELGFRSQPSERRDDRIEISEEFIELKVQPLVRNYELFVKRSRNAQLEERMSAIPPPDEQAARFKIVNGDYRGMLDRELAALFSRVTHERMWQGVFIRPMAAKLSSNFGDRRTYVLGDEEIGTSTHNGFDMASTERDIVRASNEGIVRLADDFGIYGNTIVVDHGLGVSTLYSHLSVIQVKVGDRVLKGDIIGRTGVTGFAGGDHLHFELRVGEVPVSPIEWWDPKWYADNVELKVSSAKARL